ncbi:hypothetical protein GCM10027403_02940 [Arthrobacter tecti]
MTEPQHEAAPASRPRLRYWGAGAAVLATLALGSALIGGIGPEAPPETAPTPAATSATAAPAPTPTTAEASEPDEGPEAAAPERLVVESAGIDVAVLPLTPTPQDQASQSLVPPFTLDGYWLTNYGMPGSGSKDTTYITGHSWEDREAPFNHLSTDTEVGDEVILHTESGEQRYEVDSITTHDKDTLKDSDIWDIVPNRLVLISCYTEDPWGKNVVVTAVPANEA